MPPQTRSRVLCVDDDEDACEMLSVLLDSYGIDVTCVGSAAEAWSLIKAVPFDLYVLDGWLPKVDGFEFCRQLREADSDTPIVFYSGAAYETDKQKGMSAGANAYLVKPNLEGLIETMLDVIAQARRENVPASWVGKQRRPTEKRFSGPLFSFETASD
jgi:DNA-binding response OmpR family regulator